jgi:predicted transcriptional regulator
MKRRKIEVLCKFLRIVNINSLNNVKYNKTVILKKINTNLCNFNDIKDICLNNGFIIIFSLTPSSKHNKAKPSERYVITKKGIDFMKKYDLTYKNLLELERSIGVQYG